MGRVSNLNSTHIPFPLSFFSGFEHADAAEGGGGNSHSAFVGITAASLPTLRPIFKLMSGERFSQLFSQLWQSKSRSGPSKPGSKSLSNNNEGKNSFKRPNDGNDTVKMNNRTEMSQQAALSNQQPDSSQLSLLPQNSVLVTTSFSSHSTGPTRQDLESGSLGNEIYGER